MRKLCIYIFIFQWLGSAAQNPFTVVRERLERHDPVVASRIIDSCEKQRYLPDSTMFYKGLLYLKTGKIKKAADVKDQILKDYPSFNEVHYLSGLIFFMEKNYGKSIQEFNEVLKINPGNLKVLFNRSLACGLLEDYPSAIGDLNKYIELCQTNSQAFYSRAYWYELSGQFSQAIADYETTIKMDAKNYDAYLGLANVHHLQENREKACEVLANAIQQGSEMAIEASVLLCK